MICDLDISINFGMLFALLRICFNRSEIGAPVAHSHEDRAADDVADGYGQQISPQEIDPTKDIRINARNACEPRAIEEQYSRRDEVHVGNAVLKPDGDKGHDRKEDGEYLPDDLAGGKRHPDSQADEPVATDPPPQGLAEAEGGLIIGNFNSSSAERSIPCLPKAGVVEEDG